VETVQKDRLFLPKLVSKIKGENGFLLFEQQLLQR